MPYNSHLCNLQPLLYAFRWYLSILHSFLEAILDFQTKCARLPAPHIHYTNLIVYLGLFYFPSSPMPKNPENLSFTTEPPPMKNL
mmetsp:Transcript_36649/g.76901  ORF Transcript_36649/g.76901 Transcript_36649/m.76901 type:complete len:85 (-) Transcript_36649:27-281(-)